MSEIKDWNWERRIDEEQIDHKLIDVKNNILHYHWFEFKDIGDETGVQADIKCILAPCAEPQLRHFV